MDTKFRTLPSRWRELQSLHHSPLQTLVRLSCVASASGILRHLSRPWISSGAASLPKAPFAVFVSMSSPPLTPHLAQLWEASPEQTGLRIPSMNRSRYHSALVLPPTPPPPTPYSQHNVALSVYACLCFPRGKNVSYSLAWGSESVLNKH